MIFNTTMHLHTVNHPYLRPAIRSAVTLLLAAFISACSQANSPAPPDPSLFPPSRTSTLTADLSPVPTPINQATPEPGEERENAINLLFYLPVEGPFRIGEEVTAVISAEPVVRCRSAGNQDESLDVSIVPWEVKPFELEQDLCIAWIKPCPAAGSWMRLDDRTVLRRDVEWIGQRLLWVTVRYRDSSGRIVPVYPSGADSVDIAQVSLEIEGVWDRSTPIVALPAPIQTALAGTQSAYPLTGLVQWEGGRCCAGGTAGETIQLQAKFSVSNLADEIEEMRVRTGGKCFTETELAQSAWEPFVLEKSYPFTLPINWVGFYITVQYRDLGGNLSPVYCDDISLEGIPPRNP